MLYHPDPTEFTVVRSQYGWLTNFDYMPNTLELAV